MFEQQVTNPQPEELSSYARLLVNRWDVYLSVGLAGHWVCRKQPLSRGALTAALAGEIALGLYSVDRDGQSRWACLDLDDNSRGARLPRVIEQLEQPEQALLEASRRGFHLWLLLEPSPWLSVQRWALQLARRAGLEGIEIFPKGEGLNGVRAPLTPHPKDGQIYPLIDPASGEVSAAPWTLIASRQPGGVPETVAESLPTPRQPVEGGTDHRVLVAEIERYTRLRFYGPERAIGRCPLHDDRRPSLGVLGGYWRCFAGCGEGGLNAFRARMRHQGGR
jgi:hypothetical protein